MFCEPTRHAALVRHPANFWSNIPYLLNGLYLLCQARLDLVAGSRARPFALADALFGVVAFAHALASFAWHGSGCAEVHFVDIGLMNCIILYMPLRLAALAAASLLRCSDSAVSLATAACFAAAATAALRGALQHTPTFLQAFPTGRARGDLTVVEMASIIATPALYALPAWATVALRRRWGHIGALQLAAWSLPLGFGCQMTERWALDLYCDPSSYLQPTAGLHLCTGLTIAAAYAHARSLETARAKQ
jgi:hypothetical protein